MSWARVVTYLSRGLILVPPIDERAVGLQDEIRVLQRRKQDGVEVSTRMRHIMIEIDLLCVLQ